jgi:ketosteroid isomerase-like protein
MATDTPQRRAPASNVPAWVSEHYRLVDAAALDQYIDDFADDVELRFANFPPVHGREAARGALGAGHAAHDMAHTIVAYFEDGPTSIIEFEVHYTYRDGRTLDVPSCAFIHRDDDGRFDRVRIYLDQHFPAGES